MASDFSLRPAGTRLPQVRVPPLAPRPDGGPEILRSPYCGIAMYKNQTSFVALSRMFLGFLSFLRDDDDNDDDDDDVDDDNEDDDNDDYDDKFDDL
ncbi:hypothetical protein PoB_001774000 [Plakobranchus ocellatus]|uniref:Uncharacterized protein n=1 Tax=Plakobranchus ocellatus TaxID=259542 RepID=A0AAV3Z6W1_9GAST|nr:hypothetical protein PoB_001774000 [Plakobranchus ocellatus]